MDFNIKHFLQRYKVHTFFKSAPSPPTGFINSDVTWSRKRSLYSIAIYREIGQHDAPLMCLGKTTEKNNFLGNFGHFSSENRLTSYALKHILQKYA